MKKEVGLELKTVYSLGFLEQDYTHERLGFRKERLFLFQAIVRDNSLPKVLEGNKPFWVSLNDLSAVDLRPVFLKDFIQIRGSQEDQRFGGESTLIGRSSITKEL